MVETVGKALSQARLKKGLTVDEAAHATRMRPDKIVALENDDYSRFGSNTYAKSFLLLYGRFLKVDVSEPARLLESPHEIRVHDYQYLSHAPAPNPGERERSLRRGGAGKPSLAPLVGFILLIVLGGIGFYLYVAYQRLKP